MPVRIRSSDRASTSLSGIGFALPATPQPRGVLPAFGSGSATSSWRVFQSRQDGHWPSHLGLWWPHSAQPKTVFTLGGVRDTRRW